MATVSFSHVSKIYVGSRPRTVQDLNLEIAPTRGRRGCAPRGGRVLYRRLRGHLADLALEEAGSRVA
jgi:hypothetical protein